MDDKKPFFSYHSQNIVKVRKISVKSDGRREMVCPEKMNRTPRRFKEKGDQGLQQQSCQKNDKNETK